MEYTRHISCSDFPYECDNALCIRYSSKCDGYNDCGDNTDEIGCDGSGSSGMYTLYMYNVKCIVDLTMFTGYYVAQRYHINLCQFSFEH